MLTSSSYPSDSVYRSYEHTVEHLHHGRHWHPGVERWSVPAVSADTSLTAEEDLYDLPPAYSLLDVPRPSLRIRATDDNGDVGGERYD